MEATVMAPPLTNAELSSEPENFPSQSDRYPDCEATYLEAVSENVRRTLGLPLGTHLDTLRAAWPEYLAVVQRNKAAAWERRADTRKFHEGAERLWRACDAPSRHRACAECFTSPEAWLAKRETAWSIVERGGIVALIGSRGNGKTQLAADLLHRACWSHWAVQYLKAMDFFVAVRETFRESSVSDEGRILAKYAEPRMLVIDNVDRRGSSEWEDRLLTHLVDKRYDRCVGTLLIANLDEKAFAAHVGADIVDRIRDGGGLIVADWPGFRGA